MLNFPSPLLKDLDTDVFRSLDTFALCLPSSWLTVTGIPIPSKKHHWDPKFHMLPLITGSVSPLSVQLRVVLPWKEARCQGGRR